MNLYKRLLGSALAFIVLLTAASMWQVRASPVPTTADRLALGGTLRVGFAVEKPYAFFGAGGQVTGEAPEIFRLMARRAGITRIEWVRLDFASLLPELRLGRIDAIASGMFITPERELEAIFTRPTASVRPALVVRYGESRIAMEPTLNSMNQIEDFRWVTVLGAVEKELLLQGGVSPQQIRPVPKAQQGTRVVAESHADAFAISAVTASALALADPQQMLETRIVTDGPVGLPAFAFRPADASLRDAMNHALSDFLGSAQHVSLVKQFGFTQSELPPTRP